MAKDYYQILGVERGASKDDIKKAFYKQAHKYHPDKPGGDAEKFKEMSEAYSVLSDDKRRAEYDRFGQTFGGGGPGGGTGGFDFSGFQNGNFQDFDLGDIFGEFFGGGAGAPRGGRARERRGRDVSIDVEVDFKESVFGTEREVTLSKISACSTCKGSGGKPGTATSACPVCKGKGQVEETRSSFFGSFRTVAQCGECHGTGSVPKEKCPDCAGKGVRKQQETLLIVVPPGISNGEMLRVSGKGEAAPGGASGDFYVNVRVKRHPVFTKEGANLIMELSIKVTDAILGGTYPVETLDGLIDIKVPAGTAFGDVLRVKGKGVPLGSGRRGDLLVRITVTLPAKLSKDAKKLLEELRKEGV
jgi:molecular chaperone DnaJ